ncbi:MAG: hypothetical protein Ct9H300mP1_29040 [Planctomycetaceae bacterium]|nr:MAG: hypothetical protein Ct9H300mP1_29040 [Planctomycetaceae bacterium]
MVTDEAVAWLTKLRDKEKPFFLFVNYHEPHDPIASAPRFTKRYSDKGQRSRFQPDISSLAAHHGNVTQMDDAFGRLMKTLDEQNLSQNTMVFFTSDKAQPSSNRTLTVRRDRCVARRGRLRRGEFVYQE